MASFNKIEIFVEDLAEAIHDLDTDQLTVALTTNAQAPVTTDNVLADITEISYTNLSARDIGGAALVLSQFTLCGYCRKGRRPSFDKAAPPDEANALYEYFVAKLGEHDVSVKTGVFQAEMIVHIDNDGPVTLIIDSRPTR